MVFALMELTSRSFSGAGSLDATKGKEIAVSCYSEAEETCVDCIGSTCFSNKPDQPNSIQFSSSCPVFP